MSITVPGGLDPITHERVLALLTRREMLTASDPMADEAVKITEAVRRMTTVRRSTGYGHGDSGYTGHGCRCPTCCDAHAQAQRDFRERRREKQGAEAVERQEMIARVRDVVARSIEP